MEWQDVEGIDFWIAGGTRKSSRIMVSPKIENSFEKFLVRNQIEHNLFIDNVEPTLQRDKNSRLKARGKRSVLDGEPNFELYWTFDEMNDYSKQLAQNYPNLVKRDVIGKSFEGREMFGMRISNATEFGKKPIVFIEAGLHAREWVGHASTLYLLNQLVTNETVSKELLDKVDWVIVPNANPDGYVWSFNEDRLWRKNRRYVNYTCTGIDLNRNFAYVWMPGSPNSCGTLTYPGASPLSEPETQALTQYAESFKYNLRMYLSTHSYGNYVLWPWGFEFNRYVQNWKEHNTIGNLFASAIRAATGEDYAVGNSADLLYTSNGNLRVICIPYLKYLNIFYYFTGASDDHAMAYANANIAFTLELTGGGANGFDFPQDMVGDLVKETFHGFRALGLYMGEHYNYL